MKTNWLITSGATFAAILIFSAGLHSQAPGAEKSPLQTAQSLKTKNVEIIEKQTQTLQKLDDLAKAVAQLKAFGKRT